MIEPLLLLDRKIDLNRQTARTLEALAQRLFKSWFVDFDPVHAKMDGRTPAHTPPDIAAVFPDRLVDSPLGPIPEGWEIEAIEKLVSIKGGATPPTKEPDYWEGGTFDWATPKDLSGLQQKVLISTDRKITSAGVDRISSGQLPAGTVLMSSRAPVGYLALADMPVSINQGFIAMICDRLLPNTFVLHWAESNMDVIKSNAGGSTFAEISKKQFRPLEVIVPPAEILSSFQRIAGDLYQRVAQLAHENLTLDELRDRLLPKLISGELRVPEARDDIEKSIA
jgi:type I restriction enzyme S subunit